MLLIDVGVNDLLSAQKSTSATRLLNNVQGLRIGVQQRDVVYLRNWFEQNLQPGTYFPPDNLLRSTLVDPKATPPFFIPLNVYNSGSRHGDIGCVLMVAELTSDRTQKWAYGAYFELDESKAISSNQDMRDPDKFAAFFSGRVVGPNSSAKLPLYFLPQFNALGIDIVRTNLVPGTYDLRITGLDPRGRPAFTVVLPEYTLTEDNLLNSFKNRTHCTNPGLERAILKAMKPATPKVSMSSIPPHPRTGAEKTP